MKKKAFTLVETLVGIAVFTLIAAMTYQSYVSLFKLVRASQVKMVAINVANEQIEIIRNLPYSDVGILGGLPAGKIPLNQTMVRNGVIFTSTTTVRNIDLPFDGTIASSTDPSPADNKVVEIEVGCDACQNFTPIVLSVQVAPKNLETASTNGALFIKVFDAAGQPVSDADVTITSTSTTITDSTDINGRLQIIDITPGSEAYTVNVSKGGYSTDQKDKITILVQQVTQVSLSIDKVSKINFKSLTDTCVPVTDFDFNLKGSKGYNTNLSTDSDGNRTAANMKWDTYTITANDGTYDIIGFNPLNPFLLSPDTEQTVKLIVDTKNPKTLLVTVKDNNLLPVSGADVELDEVTKVTGRGSHTDTDWDTSSYTDGNIDYTTTPGEFSLVESFGEYVPAGTLYSPVFDSGSPSFFQKFQWRPEYQPLGAGTDSARFQIATAASSSGPWIYRGPDAATSTYYTSSDSTLNTIHNGDRYFRYKADLSTISATSSPLISDVSFTFTTECTPPGQVVFTGLSNGTYDLTVSKAGYSTVNIPITISGSSGAWKEQEVILTP